MIVDAVMKADLPLEVKRKTVLALNKLMWLQSDLFNKYYVRDGEEYTQTFCEKNFGKTKQSVASGLVGVGLGAALAVAAAKFFFKN